MFKWFLMRLPHTAVPLCFDRPGDGSGGGAADHGNDGGGDEGGQDDRENAGAGDDGDQGDDDGAEDGRQARGDGGDDDDVSDEDLLFDADGADDRLPPEKVVEKIRKNNRRLRRRLARANEIAKRFRGADGQPVDVDTVLQNARRYEELEARASRGDRRAIAELEDGGRGPRDDRGSDQGDERIPHFPMTKENLGFDPTESRPNQLLAAALRDVHVMKHTLRSYGDLRKTVRSLGEGIEKSGAEQSRREWESETARIMNQVKKSAPRRTDLHDILNDALIGARATARQHGQSAKQVVDSYIEKLRRAGTISNQQAGQLSQGVRRRMANHNNNLPRNQGGRDGQPAGARGNKPYLMKDAHAQLRQGNRDRG